MHPFITVQPFIQLLVHPKRHKTKKLASFAKPITSTWPNNDTSENFNDPGPSANKNGNITKSIE